MLGEVEKESYTIEGRLHVGEVEKESYMLEGGVHGR